MNGHRAIVVGATGAVGSALVKELLASPFWDEVMALTRRPAGLFDGALGEAKLRQRVIDFNDLERETAAAAHGASPTDTAFCTLGVGQPRKLARDEVWKIDVDYAGAFARGARAAGAVQIALLSSVGADPAAGNFYLRLKGAAEAAVLAAGFPRTSLFRPSLLVTPEIRYGLQDRITQLVVPLLAPVLPRRMHPIRVEDLGRAMRIQAERGGGEGVEILYYGDFLNRLAAEPEA
jgi:uncharacterized protein YbjT (DUF2867 family)